MKAILTGLLWFAERDVPPDVLQAYTYPHPFEDMIFETYVKKSGKIGLPYGSQKKLHALIPGVEVEDRRITPKVGSPIHLTGLKLRPYQEDTLRESLKFIKDGGTCFNLSGKAGSGKSVLIAALLAKLGVKSLIIAHMSMLTEQLAHEISKATDADVTTLNSKNLELHDINIATSQFISKRPELWKEIKHNIGCIIVDESETAAALTTLRILQRAHAKYKIFVSATFSRSTDRRTEALYDLASNKIIQLERPDLLVPNIIMVRCPEVYPPYSSKFQVARDKSKFFEQYSITEKILFLATASILKSRSVLIATDIITMQIDLAERLQEYGVGILNGKTSKKERVQILEDFDAGTLKVLIGAAVLNAGISIPRISTIIRASFPSSPEKSVQLVGRALRDFDGKDGAFVFDLVFSGKSASKRISAYKRNGYKVTSNTWERVEQHLRG